MANLPKTAESIRTGIPQAKVDFSNSSQHELEAFLRRINMLTVAAAHSLLKSYDFSSTMTLADVDCGPAGLALTFTKAYAQMRTTAIDLPMVRRLRRRSWKKKG